MDLEEILGSRGKIRILRILAEFGEMYLSEIARKANLNVTTTLKHLELLKKAGIVREKRFGRIRIYSYAFDDGRARIIKEFFEKWDNFNG